MVTKNRIWYPSAIYHITNRGNRKEIIFREEMDYRVYLVILKNTVDYYEEYNYEIISYCLMSNHVHLLIKTNNKEPGYFMRRVNSMYARYFNDKYEYVGHLFQERYFSNIITNDIELLEVSRYIDLNPVKAQIVKKAEDYKWSSYSSVMRKGECKISNIYLVLDCFKLNKMQYKEYVEEKDASGVNP